MALRRIRVVAWLTLVVSLVLAVPRGASADGPAVPWERVSEKNGITIYRREVPGSDVIAFKGDGVVNAPLVRVASVIFDTARGKEWIDSLADARVVRRISDLEYIEYDHFSTPPIVMKDRDFVVSNKFEYDRARRVLTIRLRSVTDPAAPPTSYVRGELISSSFVLIPTADGKATRVIGEIHCDPRGSVPKWIVNMFQKSWPRNTLESLRTQVAKPNIVDNPAIRRLVEEPPPAAPAAQ